MGKASAALQQALGAYGISQNRLATELGVKRSIVHRWFHGQVDPSAETVANLADALRRIEPGAAQVFIETFFGQSETLDNSGLGSDDESD
ncbi:MAG: helix-turn-helix transcriptional regulator [Spirulinaceae cyanobacterium SM2_1_0]|nr:helix-turn-helix transcriptional regulator [Spirulinaceae cyanobacterium SM2_1_0]